MVKTNCPYRGLASQSQPFSGFGKLTIFIFSDKIILCVSRGNKFSWPLLAVNMPAGVMMSPWGAFVSLETVQAVARYVSECEGRPS